MKILIDLESIKPNPEYGEGGYRKYLPGSTIVQFECHGLLPPAFMPGVNCFVTANAQLDGIMHWIGQLTILADEFDFSKLEHQISHNLSFTFEREQIDCTTKDTPEEYLYEYVPTFVTCNDCGASFKYTYLESDVDGDDCCDEVCPICNVWYCCDIQYEDIKDALERKEDEKRT